MNRETITYEQFTKVIDHSLLQPQLTEDDVFAGCQLAKQYDTASVCVKPYHVKLAAQLLADTPWAGKRYDLEEGAQSKLIALDRSGALTKTGLNFS